MMDFSIFLLSLAGFASLLLAMPRHQTDWVGRKLSVRFGYTLRLSGFAALVLAFAIACVGFGWAYGAVVWFGWLTVAAALIVTAHTNRERIMRRTRR